MTRKIDNPMMRKTNDGHGTISHFLAMALLPFLGVVILSSSAATRTWTGAVSSDWDEPGNWQDGDGNPGVPVDGDAVVIGSSTADVSVKLSSSTPMLSSLEVGNLLRVYNAATLTVYGWNTCIQATNIVFGGKAKVTCNGPSATIEEMSRVWIKCHNITVKKESTTNQKGAIDVNGKGYAAAGKVSSRGRGPGNAPFCGSGSHGGYGGLRGNLPSRYYTEVNMYPASLPYDDPENPTQPGSSGAASANSGVGHGGGVVRIEATGTVTVSEGSITAKGSNAGAHNTNNTDASLGDGGGAGGTIYISCAKFAGSSGTLSVDGGGGDNPKHATTSPAGAGGCIAIHYATGFRDSLWHDDFGGPGQAHLALHSGGAGCGRQVVPAYAAAHVQRRLQDRGRPRHPLVHGLDVAECHAVEQALGPDAQSAGDADDRFA